MKTINLFIALLIGGLIWAQNPNPFQSVDRKMAAIPFEKNQSTQDIANYIKSLFQSENDKIRAIFYWTATQIRYDIARSSSEYSFDNASARINRTLKTHKGVCADYSLVFNDLATLVAIKSYIIHGYTKQNGKINSISHAWCAAKIDSKWYLFDPTWGAGYVNKNQFFPKLNTLYFKVEPSKMILSHIPFDYLWQFLEYPVSNQEFLDGKISAIKDKKKFDFIQELTRYETISKGDKFFESAQRIEKNGITNSLIAKSYQLTKKNWEVESENQTNEKFNQITAEFNNAIVQLNDFIQYRNKKFKPQLADDEIKNGIETPTLEFRKCLKALEKISPTTSQNKNNVNRLRIAITEALKQSESHLAFVNEYLAKNTLARKMMFYKTRIGTTNSPN